MTIEATNHVQKYDMIKENSSLNQVLTCNSSKHKLMQLIFKNFNWLRIRVAQGTNTIYWLVEINDCNIEGSNGS